MKIIIDTENIDREMVESLFFGFLVVFNVYSFSFGDLNLKNIALIMDILTFIYIMLR